MTACPQCSKAFERKRPDQRYCSSRCRHEHYQHVVGDGALRAPVRSVKRLADGSVSVTLRFAAMDAQNAFCLTPGDTVEVIHEQQ